MRIEKLNKHKQIKHFPLEFFVCRHNSPRTKQVYHLPFTNTILISLTPKKHGTQWTSMNRIQMRAVRVFVGRPEKVLLTTTNTTSFTSIHYNWVSEWKGHASTIINFARYTSSDTLNQIQLSDVHRTGSSKKLHQHLDRQEFLREGAIACLQESKTRLRREGYQRRMRSKRLLGMEERQRIG